MEDVSKIELPASRMKILEKILSTVKDLKRDALNVKLPNELEAALTASVDSLANQTTAIKDQCLLVSRPRGAKTAV
jgi:hypothetical protein